MITIIVDKVSDWEKLKNKFKISNDETFYMPIQGSSGENVLVWFIKDNVKYSVRCNAPLYKESIKARIHDNQ